MKNEKNTIPSKLNKQDSRKHPAAGYDEKNPNQQFPTHSGINIKKVPSKK
jgi:hypothetical protein